MDGVCVIADDEPLIVEVMGRMVARARPEADVRTFNESLLAMEFIDSQRPSMLITDLVMPGCSGADLIDAARSRWRELPVVLATAYGPVGASTLRFETLCYLRKPFRSPDLFRALDEAPERARVGARAVAWDMMRSRVLAGQSGSLTMYRGGEPAGVVGLHRGALVHAEDASGAGREAWRRMWYDGDVSGGAFEPGGVYEQSITMGHPELISSLNEERT